MNGGALLREDNHTVRLPKRIMTEKLENGGQRGSAGKREGAGRMRGGG